MTAFWKTLVPGSFAFAFIGAAASARAEPYPYVGHCASTDRSRDFSFAERFPLAKMGEYPRYGRVMYRAIRDDWEVNPSRFIQAALGDPTAFFQTYGMRLYTEELLGAHDRRLSRDISAFLRANGVEDFFAAKRKCFDALQIPAEDREREARLIAAETLNATYEEHFRAGRIPERYLIESSRKNVDWMDDPGTFHPIMTEEDKVMRRGELMFSTIYTPNLGLYIGAGGFVVQIRERRQRSIDGNYYNYVYLGGRWGYHPNDKDEFLTPGFTAPGDIAGIYDTRTGLVYAKIAYAGNSYVAVHRSGYTDEFLSGADLTDAPKARTRVVGVIAYCAAEPCELPAGLGAKLSWASAGEIGAAAPAIQRALSAAVKPKAGALALINTLDSIQVVKARYGTLDLTEKVRAWCDGKQDCDYKLSDRFVFGKDSPEFRGDAEVEWTCAKDPAKTPRKSALADPARDRLLALRCGSGG